MREFFVFPSLLYINREIRNFFFVEVIVQGVNTPTITLLLEAREDRGCQPDSDYEDRLALYRQSIWTCQCTGHTGLTHKEAWMSEAKVRVAAKTAVPLALQRPLLVLVHHSLSPLEQLIDAASILCYSQYHVGEELVLLNPPKQLQVRIVKSKDLSLTGNDSRPTDSQHIANGIKASGKDNSSFYTSNSNGISKGESPGTSPGKENQTKELHSMREESFTKKGMLPKFYDVITLEDQKLIENVPANNLLRPYKVPSKDQLRLFIRSCALRHRGSTCTPWVVADDLIKKFNIPNKLPSLFLSSPKPGQTAAKRKAQSLNTEGIKRAKSESSFSNARKENVNKVPPLVIRPENPQPGNKSSSSKHIDSKFKIKNDSPYSLPPPARIACKPNWSQGTKTIISMGKPKILPRPSNISAPIRSLPTSKTTVPRKRGRPPLSKEEKERNRKMKQATLQELSNKIHALEEQMSIVKVKTNCNVEERELPPSPQNSIPHHPLMMLPYRPPVKRANTPETIMKLPFMRRFLHEHKTIKGVLGQFRRYAYTMDLVLSKLSEVQIEMIPIEALKLDLRTRQKKVRDKKFIEALTPEEKKQFLKDKARTVALERWKERKLKNLKIEDRTVSGLIPLPEPALVDAPKLIPNYLFGDIVMVTEFMKCFRELIMGEEKFRISSSHIMEAIAEGSKGYKVLADVMCCVLPLIIHDDICKNCKEIGVSFSSIPVSYQTAPELSRLCLRKQDDDEVTATTEDNYLVGKEKTELSDELLTKLEHCEVWELDASEIVAVLRALIHKALCTAVISVYVEEVEEKVLQTLRERRKFMRTLQKEQRAEMEKRKEQRLQNRIAKGAVKKKQRGRPRGSFSKPNVGALPDYFGLKENEKEEEEVTKALAEESNSVSLEVQERRKSTELQKSGNADLNQLEKEKQKQLEEEQKRQSMDRKYEEIVFKRDNLVRRTPIGFDRDHNRYWIFHTTTPGLYVEKGWVGFDSDYTYTLRQMANRSQEACNLNLETRNKTDCQDVKVKTSPSDDEDEKPLSIIIAEEDGGKGSPTPTNSESREADEDSRPLSSIKSKIKTEEENENSQTTKTSPYNSNDEEDNKPLSFVKSKIKKEMDEDNRPLSAVKSKLSLSPMKMTYRGRPPKEAYVLVDEDTQTFPRIGENKWYYYKSQDEVKQLMACLSDQGQRESQLIAAININMERLKYHFNKKVEPFKASSVDYSERLKESLKEDIIQIEKELIEGWLGGVANFEEWEAKTKEAKDLSTLGQMLIEAQRCMQLKYLKSIMAPVKEPLPSAADGAPADFVDRECEGVAQWRESVRTSKTYSRLHVLVGIFDSCIKWEHSMATRKCKVCRSKVKTDPLVMCSKCENSYHMTCLRPPLKEDPGEAWSCLACQPKMTRREETQEAQIGDSESVGNDADEKNDPTFKLVPHQTRKQIKKKSISSKTVTQKKQEKECVVCYGRIGLISCSKCSTAYHSECHDPPLLSRARKDWMCGSCLNPSKHKSIANPSEEDVDKPMIRRNYFGNIEEVYSKRRSGNTGPRDKFGRFLCGGFDSMTSSKCKEGEGPPHKDWTEEKGTDKVEEKQNENEEEEEEDGQMDKFGRSIRGAKAKALENMDSRYKTLQDSRRSSRTQDKKNYKDESDDEGEKDTDGDEESNEENEEEQDKRSCRDESEDESEKQSDDESNEENEAEEQDKKSSRDESEDEGEKESDEDSNKEDGYNEILRSFQAGNNMEQCVDSSSYESEDFESEAEDNFS